MKGEFRGGRGEEEVGGVWGVRGGVQVWVLPAGLAAQHPLQ